MNTIKRLCLFIGIISIFPISLPAAIGIDISPNSWNVGTAGAGVWISPMMFSVTNIGDQSVKLQIRATNTQNWWLGSSPSLNTFSMQWGQEPTWTSITTLNATFISPFNIGQIFSFYLRYQSPTSIEPITLTETQNSTITISAISPAIGVWEKYLIAGNVTGQISLALDKNNYPHIAYQDSNEKKLKYAKWDGTTWTIQVVDNQGNTGVTSSIDLDDNDNPHISYYGSSLIAGWSCKYAKWTGEQWQVMVIEDKVYTGSGLFTGMKTSMQLDSNNIPQIVYYSPEPGNTQPGLKYARLVRGTTWDIQTIEIGDMTGQWPSLSIDNNNRPHITYNFYGNLKYIYWTGASWLSSYVDMGVYSSIAVDRNNYPNIAYYDYKNYDLKYAKYNGSSWVINTIDSSGDVGVYCAMKIDGDNHPHISYHDATNKDLKYTTFDGTNWKISVVDSPGEVGVYTSIAIDANNYPHISYLDIMNNVLKYTRWR